MQDELIGSQLLASVVAERCHTAWDKRERNTIPRKEGNGMRLAAQGICLQLLKRPSRWETLGEECHTIGQDSNVHAVPEAEVVEWIGHGETFCISECVSALNCTTNAQV